MHCAAAEGGLVVEIMERQVIAWCAIVGSRGHANFGRFRILIAENKFVGATDTWAEGIKNLQIARAKIA